jgi:hypothetical protein
LIEIFCGLSGSALIVVIGQAAYLFGLSFR